MEIRRGRQGGKGLFWVEVGTTHFKDFGMMLFVNNLNRK
jgi:hypothetical protein